MVNNISCALLSAYQGAVTGWRQRTFEEADTHIFGQLLSFLVDGNIETKDTSQFLRFLQHRSSTHDILLMHGTDVDTRDGDLADLEEIEKGFKRTKGTGLNTNTPTRLVNGVEQSREVGHDFVLEVIFIIVGANDQKSRTSNSLLEIGSNDLDTKSSLNFLVVDIGRLEQTL